MIIYAADDPLVLSNVYDREGYKPGERVRIAKSRARQLLEEERMAKKQKPSRSAGKSSRAHRVNTVKANGGLPESREVAPVRKSRPRQQDLPGTEDRAIKPLEDAAADYAEIRDRRMALNAEEVGLKAKVLRLMKQHGKQTYRRDGVLIEIVVEEETVKVKVKKPGDEDETVIDTEDRDETTAEQADDVTAAAEGLEP